MATYTDNYNLTKPTFAESADIRTINGNMDTIDDVLHASQVSLADAYDETRTASNPYNTGDIVMYELLMYKCLEDGVYGTWDGTKWERTTAGANGGGSDVEVTPSYNSGTKIAEIDVDGNTEEIYVPEMTGASSSSDGTAGLPPAPETGDEDKFFRGDGTWAEVGGGADYVELTQAEYDALTPAQKMNGTMYFITDASGGGGGEVFLAPMIYSTEEREVGVWVDDKPLYQKTLIANYASGVNSGAHVVESIEDIEIVNGFGSYVESSGYIYTMPYAQTNGTSFHYYEGDVVFSIGPNVGFGAGTLYVTIQYTKDSDVAGSGSYGSLGIPMEHYDDTERVVGTWFGDTLYAKSYDVDNPSSNTSIITEDFSDKVITDITAIGIRSSDGAIIPLQFTTTSNWMRVYAGTIYGGIYLESNIALSNIKITIKYTKSST